jgi:hypothetical protein
MVPLCIGMGSGKRNTPFIVPNFHFSGKNFNALALDTPALPLSHRLKKVLANLPQ